MAEYIEREAAIEAAKHAWAKGLYPSQYLEDIPAADVAPVRHGEWIQARFTDAPLYICSECYAQEYKQHNYCPHCGAKMDL